ncbi:hypothetical protein C8Q69DRAFT_499884 [Paecilomyces variotii]|uniref:Uncharacterized protein n=1 Tax=Byssochlamys spectabilis TaxID=264951 RepID=A0A443HQW1_BYSSP|nr:hypothetical protein C8Q69DRAFT_499884 [Paecilomyces variotii]RWQ94197.1 hypothetical protein C8Q69DRAFT_499884 [Paecilomyces variotii]
MNAPPLGELIGLPQLACFLMTSMLASSLSALSLLIRQSLLQTCTTVIPAALLNKSQNPDSRPITVMDPVATISGNEKSGLLDINLNADDGKYGVTLEGKNGR